MSYMMSYSKRVNIQDIRLESNFAFIETVGCMAASTFRRPPQCDKYTTLKIIWGSFTHKKGPNSPARILPLIMTSQSPEVKHASPETESDRLRTRCRRVWLAVSWRWRQPTLFSNIVCWYVVKIHRASGSHPCISPAVLLYWLAMTWLYGPRVVPTSRGQIRYSLWSQINKNSIKLQTVVTSTWKKPIGWCLSMKLA